MVKTGLYLFCSATEIDKMLTTKKPECPESAVDITGLGHFKIQELFYPVRVH